MYLDNGPGVEIFTVRIEEYFIHIAFFPPAPSPSLEVLIHPSQPGFEWVFLIRLSQSPGVI